MKKNSLLLLEDEGYVIDRLQEILRDFPHFEVETCDDAARARELLENRPYDVIITDIYLRGVSGLELSHKARKKNPDAAVILITGLDSLEIASKAVKEGALDYVLKPPGLERLRSILRLLSLVRGLSQLNP